jgi:hypothetical protein
MQIIFGFVIGVAGGLLGFLGSTDDTMAAFGVRQITGILTGLMCGYLGWGIGHEIQERKWLSLYLRLSIIAACPILFIILNELGLETVENQRRVIEGLVLGAACLTACICEYLTRVPAIRGAERLAGVFTPFLSLLHYHTILCSHCLRYSSPFQSRYAKGKRYCEHCAEPVESTSIPGHVILTFGAFSPTELQAIEDRRQRVFLRENPIFGTIPANPETGIFLSSTHASEHGKQPIDVSEVYLDPMTCISEHIERFITYIVNHPPKNGIQSIRIFHRGQLEYLGKALANALYNNFPQIHKMALATPEPGD